MTADREMDAKVKRTFGEMVAWVRRIRKLTQAELDIRSELPAGTVAQVEQDQREPTVSNFVKLCDGLKISADILLQRERPDFPRLAEDSMLSAEDCDFIDLVRSAVFARHRKQIEEREQIESERAALATLEEGGGK